MNITKIQESIEKNVEAYKETIEKGRAFLKWTLSYLFEQENIEENNEVNIIDGANDGGIDAWILENGIITLIQTKYNTSHSYESVLDFIEKMEKFIRRDFSKRKEKLFDIYDKFNEAEYKKIYYITNIKFCEEDRKSLEQKMKKFNEDFEEKEIELNILDIDGILNFIQDALSEIPKKFKGKRINLQIERYFKNKEQTTIIGEVMLKELADFVDKGKDYLYISNIRNYLGKNAINKEISKTYKESPKDFWYYNNGITIVCDDFEEIPLNSSACQLKITTPQIVNGCQTSSTIHREWKQSSLEERNNQEGTILVKVIIDKKGKKKPKITRYTNSQTAVTGKDFFSLQNFHKQLKKDFKELGFIYEIQRKEISASNKKKTKYSYLFKEDFDNKILAKEMTQAYTAGIHFLPGKAKSPSNIVPGGKYYEKIFSEDAPIDPRIYLYPYAVMHYGSEILEHKKDNNKKATNFLFVTIYFKLVLELLKELKMVNADQDGKYTYLYDRTLIEKLDKIFLNKEYNKYCLKSSDNILKQYLRDTTIKTLIGDNFPKFLKTMVDSNEEALKVLDQKIKDEIVDESELKSELKNILSME